MRLQSTLESTAPAAGGLVRTAAGRQVRVGWWAAVGVLLLAGLALRLYGLGWGIPAYDPATLADTPFRHSYHLDEDKFLAGLAHMQPAAGDYDVHDYHWGSLQFYLIYGALLGGEATGAIPAPWEAAWTGGDLAVLPRLYLLGRLVSVAAGGAGLLIVIALGVALGGRRAGLAAGVAYALAPLAVVEAHYLTNDVTMSVLVAGAVLAAVLAVQRDRPRLLVLAWLLLGLATAAKLPGAFAAPGLMVAQVGFWRASRGRERPGARLFTYLLLPLLEGAGGFVLGEPYLLLIPDRVLHDVLWVTDVNGAKPASGLLAPLRMLGEQLWALAGLGLTWGIAVLALGGLLLLLLRVVGRPGAAPRDAAPGGRLAAGVVLGALAGSALGVAVNTFAMLRYTQPLIPLLAVGAGLGWAAIPRPALRWGAVVPAAGLAAVITLGQLSLLAGPHPANLLLAWLGTHARPGAQVAQSWIKYPVLDPARYDVVNLNPWSPHLYAGVRPDYVILDDMMDPPNPPLAGLLAHSYREVARFSAQPRIGPFTWAEGVTPHDWKYSHPTFIVYARRP